MTFVTLKVIGVTFGNVRDYMDVLKEFDATFFPKVSKVTVFHGVQKFISHSRTLPQENTYVVLDSSLPLSQYTGITYVGHKSPLFPYKTTKFILGLKELLRWHLIISPYQERQIIQGRRLDYIRSTIEKFSNDQFLAHYSMFIYKIPKDARLQFQQHVLELLFSKKSTIKGFLKAVAIFKPRRAGSQAWAAFEGVEKYMSSAEGANYVAAFHDLLTLKHPRTLEDVADQYKIEAYEMRYFSKVREKLTKA